MNADRPDLAAGVVEVEQRAGRVHRVTTARTTTAACRDCGWEFDNAGAAASHARSARHIVNVRYASVVLVHADRDAARRCSMTAGESAFLDSLTALGVPILTASPGGKDEFIRPRRWQHATADGNAEHRRRHRPGNALLGMMGGRVTVFDVDTKNGADVARTQQALAELGIVVYADLLTPSAGRHFYVPGHPDVPTVHAQKGRDGLVGHPGVEILSYGANAFLPGTLRPKYNGAGYVIMSNNLDALVDGGDPASGEALAAFVAERRIAKAALLDPAPPWDGTAPDERQARYLDVALTRQAAALARMDRNSGRNVALYTAALKLGSYVAGAGLDQARVVEVLTDAATRCGLTAEDGPRSVAASISSGLRNGRANPRAVPDAPAGEVVGDPWAPAARPEQPRAAAAALATSTTPRQATVTITDPDSSDVDLLALVRSGDWLDAQVFPPTHWAVPGILPEGFGLLTGAPKVGKSWLVLGFALAVASGGVALGGIALCKPRPVLYLALEDGESRLQSRSRQLLGLGPIPALMDVVTDVDMRSVLPLIGLWLDQHRGQNPLVALDTLGKVMPPALPGEGAYGRDYRVGGWLKGIVREHPGSTLLVVHHVRKVTADDWMDSTSGTNGLNGSADFTVNIHRARNQADALLRVTGRDVLEAEYAVTTSAGAWTLVGSDLAEAARNATQVRATAGLGDSSAAIVDFVTGYGQPVAPKDVEAALQMPDARRYLARLAEAGRLIKVGRGLYASTSTPVPTVPLSQSAGSVDAPLLSPVEDGWDTGTVGTGVPQAEGRRDDHTGTAS